MNTKLLLRAILPLPNLEVFNYIGQTLLILNNVSEKTVKVNVVNLTAGIYNLKVTTAEGTKVIKITLTR